MQQNLNANKEKKKIAFCCDGNTCRSKMAESYLRFFCEKNEIFLEVTSFGLFAKEGDVTAKEALIALKNSGIFVRPSKAQPLKEMDFSTLSWIVCMTEGQKITLTNLLSYFLKENTPKVYSAKDFIGKEILDPYGKGILEYERTLEQLKKVCQCCLERFL